LSNFVEYIFFSSAITALFSGIPPETPFAWAFPAEKGRAGKLVTLWPRLQVPTNARNSYRPGQINSSDASL